MAKPRKGVAYVVTTAMLDKADANLFKSGETVTFSASYSDDVGATFPALTVAGAFAEVGTTGQYRLPLTAAEMNHDIILIKVSSTNGADASIRIDLDTESVDTIYSRLGAPAGTSVSEDIAAVNAVASDIQADLSNGTDGLGALKTAIDAIFTTQMTESYAADGVAPTPAQALFLIQQALTEFAISGTVNTVKRLDGTTTAATLNYDSASSPSSVTRAS